jgi:deoxyribose-phosphate aldolase
MPTAQSKMPEKPGELTRFIDHTLLRQDARESEVLTCCREAKTYHFFSVSVNSVYVPLVSASLSGSGVKTCSVVGFPLGAQLTDAKVAEAILARVAGADEIDMVMAVGALKDGKDQYVLEDIAAVKKACGASLLKVIIETGLLTNDEKRRACTLAKKAKADFVKTSTGFGNGGATVEDVQLMRKVVGPQMGVKASGGIRTYTDAMRMISAGATRLGTSSGVAIVAAKVQHQ